MEPNQRGHTGYATSGGDPLSPLPFQDVPFEESEWKPLYDLIARVHNPKAELIRARYEEMRLAYRNYIQARTEAIEQYARQRREDLQYNIEIEQQRVRVLEQIQAVHERWRPLLQELFEAKQRTTDEAYIALARLGIKPKIRWASGAEGDEALFEDDLLFGNRASSDGTAPSPSNTNGTVSTNPTSPNPTPLSPPAQPQENLPDLWERLRPPTFEEYLAETDPSLLKEPEPPTEASVAHEQNLPVFRTRVLHPALLWLMTIGAGLGLGAVFWMVLGGTLTVDALGTVGFWLAMVGGVSAMVLWGRGLWGAAAIVAELFHKFRWDEPKARREAWAVALGASMLLLVGLLVAVGSAFSWLSLRPSPPETPLLMMMLASLSVPLWLVAMVEGFLVGRAHAVQAQIDAALSQAKRQQQAEYQAQRQSAHAQYQQFLKEWERSETPSTYERPALPITPEGRVSESVSQPSPRVPSNPPVNRPSLHLIEEARVKVAQCRSAHLQYQRAKREMESELAWYQYQLTLLQRRPIYEMVSEAQYAHLARLRHEWETLYNRFVEMVAQAVEPLNDGEALREQVLRFRRNTADLPRSEQVV